MTMPNILEKISSNALLRTMERKAVADIAQLERRASARTTRGWAAALRTASMKGPAIIAELKKASPSKGVIREFYDPVALAKSFEAGGAAALSVLTDEDFFQGRLADLEAVNQVVNIPIIRKDFIVDPFQILEAKAAGADAILLIVAAHTDRDLDALHREANRWGLDVLCETHDMAEIQRALNLGFGNIGVNSRDPEDDGGGSAQALRDGEGAAREGAARCGERDYALRRDRKADGGGVTTRSSSAKH